LFYTIDEYGDVVCVVLAVGIYGDSVSVTQVTCPLHPGAVVLLHDRCDGADRLLEMIIAEIKRQGYNFAPIEEMLKIDVYEV
jgi:peptidoglycan/xylan/chitin deacetylase (PgdA/CDA1 family)